jgi:predicted enzyme related to lactoylglutathione lyase
MTRVDTPIGAFAWIVLSTSNPSAASSFYRRAFGWREMKTTNTTLLSTDEGPVAAIVAHGTQSPPRKVPQNWLPFVRVANIEDTYRLVEAHGGTTLNDLRQTDFGRGAIVRGPTGEGIGIWETPLDTGGEPIVMAPGVCPWFELVTPDPDRAAPFYRAVFGWRIADEGGYTFIGDAHGHFGGIVKLQGDWEDYAFLAAIGRARRDKLQVPPHWMIFLAVEDAEAFSDRAETLGALVTTRAEPLHAVGTFSVLRDPQGVYFSVLSRR